jgi:hypothetical protein
MIQDHGPAAAALAGVWDAAVLSPVREINEQLIDALCAAAAGTVDAGGLLAVVRLEFLHASAAARRRLADCPYLLLDAGFGDATRWPLAAGVRDAPPMAAGRPPQIDCGVPLARRALVLGWHLARSNRLAARVALGMTPACADLVGRLRLQDLEALAETEPGRVRVRWEDRAELWGPLLRAARLERAATLASLQMRGLQLLAADSALLEA